MVSAEKTVATAVHFPYSPDLALSDFFLFSKMKEHLAGKVKVSPLQAMEAHGGCGCKGPHIHSHGTRMR